MIPGCADLKMQPIGQSVHYGRLIELEKPVQMWDGTDLTAAAKQKPPKQDNASLLMALSLEI